MCTILVRDCLARDHEKFTSFDTTFEITGHIQLKPNRIPCRGKITMVWDEPPLVPRAIRGIHTKPMINYWVRPRPSPPPNTCTQQQGLTKLLIAVKMHQNLQIRMSYFIFFWGGGIAPVPLLGIGFGMPVHTPLT